MSPAKRRKTAKDAAPESSGGNKSTEPVPDAGAQEEEVPVSKASSGIEPSPVPNSPRSQPDAGATEATAAEAMATNSEGDAAPKSTAQDRMARFRALQERAKKSADQNFKEATKESQRLAADPSRLTALGRKNAIASHKLLKADVEEAGGDFERKRAWDWTVEESERWDKRVRKKEAHRDDTAFRDYGRESQKVYKRQMRGLGAPDLEKYTAGKLAAIEKAAAAGTLEIVETEDGEMIAVDKDGTFFSNAESTAFGQNKPDKAAVDRLVGEMRKSEEAALKKRRDRMAANGDDDVTYINEKNKQFNQKLNRFYNKYTAEIRESFERGTAI